MPKFSIQDRIVLDDAIDTFTRVMHQEHDNSELKGKRPIITREYWLQMISELQVKIDAFTTKKALNHSKQFR